MATESIDYVSPETKTKIEDQILFRPGQHASGIIDWLTTIDHKKIVMKIEYNLKNIKFWRQNQLSSLSLLSKNNKSIRRRRFFVLLCWIYG